MVNTRWSVGCQAQQITCPVFYMCHLLMCHCCSWVISTLIFVTHSPIVFKLTIVCIEAFVVATPCYSLWSSGNGCFVDLTCLPCCYHILQFTHLLSNVEQVYMSACTLLLPEVQVLWLITVLIFLWRSLLSCACIKLTITPEYDLSLFS